MSDSFQISINNTQPMYCLHTKLNGRFRVCPRTDCDPPTTCLHNRASSKFTINGEPVTEAEFFDKLKQQEDENE